MDLIFLMDCKVSATRAPIPMVHHLQLKNLCLLASSISKVPGQFLVLFFVSPFKRRNFFLRHHLLSGTPQALVFHELWGVVKQHLKLCHERWRFSQLFFPGLQQVRRDGRKGDPTGRQLSLRELKLETKPGKRKWWKVCFRKNLRCSDAVFFFARHLILNHLELISLYFWKKVIIYVVQFSRNRIL